MVDITYREFEIEFPITKISASLIPEFPDGKTQVEKILISILPKKKKRISYRKG